MAGLFCHHHHGRLLSSSSSPLPPPHVRRLCTPRALVVVVSPRYHPAALPSSPRVDFTPTGLGRAGSGHGPANTLFRTCRRLGNPSRLFSSSSPGNANRLHERSGRAQQHLLPWQRRFVSDTDGSSKPGTNTEAGRTNEPSSADDRTPISRGLDNAKERTKAVRDRVRSSLATTLTPRENIYNLPNFLTVSRLIAAPVTAYLLLHDYHRWALGLFAYAGFTDLVDGWLARRWKLQTVAGSVIDPMADKALMIILTVTLAIKGAIPLYLATLILGRDASLALAAIYYRYASLPSPKTFNRYWDFSLPSAEVHPTTVSKYNTFLQLLLIGSTLALPVVLDTTAAAASMSVGSLDPHAAMRYFQYLVTATTAWSGLSYAFLPRAVTILGSNEALKAKQGTRGRAIIGVTFGGVVAAAGWIAFTVDDEAERGRETK